VTKALKSVIWEWLPGVVAGFMPLFVFLLARSQTSAVVGNPAHPAMPFADGFLEHLVVFSIVTSCVSTFTSFPRLFAYNREDAPIGQASLGLVMLITLILVISVAMYALKEAHVLNTDNVVPGVLLVLATLITSIYMEIAIANVRLARLAPKAT